MSAQHASLKAAVRDQYAAVARSGLSNASPAAARVAQAFGYTAEELAAIPTSANMGLSCGNPTAMANLRPGDVVLDLGAGGGLDVFLAARKVGPAGRAIGVDMTPEMVERARRGAREAGLDNVEFHRAEIEALPLLDQSVDCAISNCVLNLVPDKGRAFAEIFRVLKPGGRLAVSDIALRQPLPAEVTENVLAYVGCIAGAVEIDEYRRQLAAAGFADIVIVDSGADLAVYSDAAGGGCRAAQPADPLAVLASGCCGAAPSRTVHHELADLMRRYDVNQYAASIKVFAVKPAADPAARVIAR